MLSLQDIQKAHARIKPFIHETPILHSTRLDTIFGHTVYFKAENLQKTGSYKPRGALNAILSLPKTHQEIVAVSSGNHAQGVAYACQVAGRKATIYMSKTASKIKQDATKGYGAKVVLCDNREEAQKKAEDAGKKGAIFISPYDNDNVICGQGTICLEALSKITPDAIFAACGGGGLLSGTWIAAKGINPKIQVFGAEPEAANDASRSLKAGKILSLDGPPKTLADGLVAPSVVPRTFYYLQKTDGFFEVSEADISTWTAEIQNTLKTVIEPSAAVPVAAAYHWGKKLTQSVTILVILSGGNTGVPRP